MKKGNLVFLLLFPFVVAFLGVSTATGGFNRIEKDLIDIQWDYPSQVGFKIQAQPIKLEAEQIYDKTCMLAYGNDLVWQIENVDPSDEEVYCTLTVSDRINSQGNFDYYLTPLKEGDVYLSVSNRKGTIKKTTTAVFYSSYGLTVTPKVEASNANIDSKLYYGEYDGIGANKKKAVIEYSFTPFPADTTNALRLEEASSNLSVDLHKGTVEIQDIQKPLEEAFFTLEYHGKIRKTSFVVVQNGVNVYDYSTLLSCTNQSEKGEIICLRKSFESLDNFALKDEKGNMKLENGMPVAKKNNVALFGTYLGKEKDGSAKWNFKNEVYSHETTGNTAYIDAWNEFASSSSLYRDSILSKSLYAGLRIQKDFYGNGYTLNFHNLAYPYGKTTMVTSDGKTATVPSLTTSNLFRGPLFTYCMGDPKRFPLIGLYGEDNAGIYLDGNDILVNDLDVKNADYGDSYSFLQYAGTVLNLHGDHIEIRNSKLHNGKNVVRAFSSKNSKIVNCLLSDALNFCLTLGSDEATPVDPDATSSFLQLDGSKKSAAYDDYLNGPGQDVLTSYLGSLGGDATESRAAEGAINSLQSASHPKTGLHDYATSLEVEDTLFYRSGVSPIGLENSFNGPFLYNLSPSLMGTLIQALNTPIDGAGHSLVPFVPKNMAFNMAPSKLNLIGKTDFFDDKKPSDFVLDGILQQDFTGLISILPDEIKDKIQKLNKDISIDAIFPLKEVLTQLAKDENLVYSEQGTISVPIAFYGGGYNGSNVETYRWKNFNDHYAGIKNCDLVHYYLYRPSQGQEVYWNLLYRIVTMVTGFAPFQFGFFDSSGSRFGKYPNLDTLKQNATSAL